MKVLITGGGGFLGSHLVESQLAQGHDVRTIDLYTDNLRHLEGRGRLQITRGTIEDSDLMRELLVDVDVVYHLASAHLDVSLSDEYYRRVNVTATVALARRAHAAGVQRFVHCSSVGVIGDVAQPPADETTPCHPENIYERTKLAGEQAVLELAHETGLSLVVARPAWIYGPRCPRTRKLIRTIRKGRFVIFGSGKRLRHPVYVTDAVAGLELSAVASNVQGQIYIIAGESPVTIETLVNTISDVLGVRQPGLRLPISLGLAAGYALETGFKIIGGQPPLSRRSMDFFRKNNAYDISKAQRDLGYTPQVDLRAGFMQTLEQETRNG